MAMLAEPRRKKRFINLRGKTQWSEDGNKFGQKMLEKMGWQKGNGLGAKQDGMIEHIKVKLKDDGSGLGFKDKNDQWTEHEDSFNGLLRSLNGGAVDTDKLHSETSLEEKSKKSRKRLHYKKFTKGKDISQYSAKDLANIFGKKTLHKKSVQLVQPVEETEEKKPAVPGYSFVESGNINDYFKSKMTANSSVQNSDNDDKSNEDQDDFRFVGFAGANGNSEESNKTQDNNTNEDFISFKSKKRKENLDTKINDNRNFVAFKSADENISSEDNGDEQISFEKEKTTERSETSQINFVKEKKSKKNKKEQVAIVDSVDENNSEKSQMKVNKKRSFKSTQVERKIETKNNQIINQSELENDFVKKEKKSKMKRKLEESEAIVETMNSEGHMRKKKKKKNK